VEGRAVLRTAGPRLLREALGPVLVFYALYKTLGTVPAVLGASAVGLGAAAWARREGRPGLVAGTAVVFVIVRAAAGLIGDSAKAYLAGDVVMDALLGTAFLASLLRGRPLSLVFAEDISPVPEDARGTDGERRVFRRLTLVWGLFFLARGTLRLYVLLSGSVDRYVLITVLLDLVFLGMIAGSVAYALRAYRLQLAGVGLQPEEQPAGQLVGGGGDEHVLRDDVRVP
jgi:uncharacterized membrane protein